MTYVIVLSFFEHFLVVFVFAGHFLYDSADFSITLDLKGYVNRFSAFYDSNKTKTPRDFHAI